MALRPQDFGFTDLELWQIYLQLADINTNTSGGGGGGGGATEQEIYDIFNGDFAPSGKAKSLFEQLTGNQYPLADLFIDFTGNKLADSNRLILNNILDLNSGLSVFRDTTGSGVFIDSALNKGLADMLGLYLNSIDGTLVQSLSELQSIDAKLTSQATAALQTSLNALVTAGNSAQSTASLQTATFNQKRIEFMTSTSFIAASLALLNTAVQTYLTSNITRTYVSFAIGNNGVNNATFNAILITKS